MDDGPVLLLRVVVSLLCVVGLIWVIARKAGATSGRRVPAGPSLQVVGRQSLGRHAGVAVLAVGNRRLLLGYGEQQVTMLTELSPVLDSDPVPGRDVAVRPVGAHLPASLTSFVAARRAGRAGTPAPADAVTDEDAPEPAATGVDAELPVVPAQAAGSGLDGSILSPATWRRAVATLQERTVRR